MDSFQLENHSFIIRIWREDTSDSPDTSIWRGHITHVPSGERRYLQKLEDITSFVKPYVENMGVNPS
jgi:hypothetical protein